MYREHEAEEIAEYLAFGLNNSFQRTIGEAPVNAKGGCNELDPRRKFVPVDLTKLNECALVESQKNLKWLNRSRRAHVFARGDLVYARNHTRGKIDSLREGPFPIVGLRAR